MERRSFLAAAGASAIAVSAGMSPANAAAAPALSRRRPGGGEPRITWTIFSRHLQWLTTQAYAQSHPYETGVLVGEAAASMGYAAVDLTVRPGGHVEPALVGTHLAPMLSGVRSTGTVCRHITTGVAGVDSEFAVTVLTAASNEGIDYYRWGTYNYPTDPAVFGDDLLTYLEARRHEARKLAQLNKRLGLTGIYHTFSGGRVGSSVWDLIYTFDTIDPGELALNFDIGHLTAEGAAGSWATNLRYAMPSIGGIGLKDVSLGRSARGTVATTWEAAGKGLVQWQPFFQILRDGGFAGPAEAQIEYTYKGESLNRTFWADTLPAALTPPDLLTTMANELTTYRSAALAGGWSADEFE